VCRSCTADLPASHYPDTVEAFKQALVDCWLSSFHTSEDE
jgi:hypothetical protein